MTESYPTAAERYAHAQALSVMDNAFAHQWERLCSGAGDLASVVTALRRAYRQSYRMDRNADANNRRT